MITKTKTIVVLAAASQDALEARGAEVETSLCDTVKAAKELALYYLTEAYRLRCEASELLGYSQVLVNGEVRYDFYGEDVR